MEKFDLIIGADILYDRADIPHLDRFWRRHLTRGGRVLLGDPGRSVTTEMLDELAVRGWRRSDSPATSRHAGKRLRIVELA